ncbi:hypothetical protein HMSSN139_24330 [Paenibacillus sp. HMSSN-139]|nr:hypothetical protein HMSSN139_24330 [Paenibacillus sp. HMSSN-139]
MRRDGDVKEIDSGEIVPGDIVILDAGRFIPADLRLLDSANLQIEESALTGGIRALGQKRGRRARGGSNPIGTKATWRSCPRS